MSHETPSNKEKPIVIKSKHYGMFEQSKTNEGRQELMRKVFGDGIFGDDENYNERVAKSFFKEMNQDSYEAFAAAHEGEQSGNLKLTRGLARAAEGVFRANAIRDGLQAVQGGHNTNTETAQANSQAGNTPAATDTPKVATATGGNDSDTATSAASKRKTGRHRINDDDIDNDYAAIDPSDSDTAAARVQAAHDRARQRTIDRTNALRPVAPGLPFGNEAHGNRSADSADDRRRDATDSDTAFDDDSNASGRLPRADELPNYQRPARRGRPVSSPFDGPTGEFSLSGLAQPAPAAYGEFVGDDAPTGSFAPIPRSPQSRSFWRRVGDFGQTASAPDRAVGRGLLAAGRMLNGLTGLAAVGAYQFLVSKSEKRREKLASLNDEERAKVEKRTGLYVNLGVLAAGAYFLATRSHITDTMPWLSGLTGHNHDTDTTALDDASDGDNNENGGDKPPLSPEAAREQQLNTLFSAEDPAKLDGKEHPNDFNRPIPIADSKGLPVGELPEQDRQSVVDMVMTLDAQWRGNPQEMAAFLGDARVEGAPWREHFDNQDDYAAALRDYGDRLDGDKEYRSGQLDALRNKFANPGNTFTRVEIDRNYGAWWMNPVTGKLEWDPDVPQRGEMSHVKFYDGTEIDVRQCGQTCKLHEIQQYQEPEPVYNEPQDEYYEEPVYQEQYEEPEPEYPTEPEEPAPEPPSPPEQPEEPPVAPPPPVEPPPPVNPPPVEPPPVQPPKPDKGNAGPGNGSQGQQGPGEQLPPAQVPRNSEPARIPDQPSRPAAPELPTRGEVESSTTPGGSSGPAANDTDPNPTR